MSIKILNAGREISLPTKTLEVIRGVIEVSSDTESIASGRITFHFKGRSVIPEMLKRYRVRNSEEATANPHQPAWLGRLAGLIAKPIKSTDAQTRA